MASEARLASLVAIAKGDVPWSHWLHLGRPFTRIDGQQALISWSATMFEYLMPRLFVRAEPDTLLGQTLEVTANRQIGYGREKDVPWAISESGYYRFDANQFYQYRAFGVPGLATPKSAELNKGYTRVYAPSDGHITRKSVEPGNQSRRASR